MSVSGARTSLHRVSIAFRFAARRAFARRLLGPPCAAGCGPGAALGAIPEFGAYRRADAQPGSWKRPSRRGGPGGKPDAHADCSAGPLSDSERSFDRCPREPERQAHVAENPEPDAGGIAKARAGALRSDADGIPGTADSLVLVKRDQFSPRRSRLRQRVRDAKCCEHRSAHFGI